MMYSLVDFSRGGGGQGQIDPLYPPWRPWLLYMKVYRGGIFWFIIEVPNQL